MSASARFLLEFQATGDQEVVNKIREVGAAGQEAATELESLQGIEDPFSAVGQGAESAIGPITEVGTASSELGGVFSEAGSASEDFGGALTGMNTEVEGVAGGLTDANTVVGEFGGSADKAAGSATTMGQSTQGAIGAFVGLGGALGSATSLAFRMQDAQLRLEKAQLKAARSTETARKAQVAFNNLLGTATTNTDGRAAASDRLSAAQAHLNELIAAGVTSGPEYAAAQQEVADATAALRGEFVEGGGAAEKFDATLAKLVNSNDAAAIAAKNLEKVTRETTQTWYELPFAIAGVTGTLIQSISSMSKFGPIATKVSGILGKLPALFTGGATGAAGLATAVGRIGPIVLVAVEGFKAFNASLALFEGLVASAAGEGEKAALKLKESFDLTKLAGGFGSSGAVMELIGKLGLDKTFDDVAKSQKKLDDQNKKTAASTKELAGSTIEYGNSADSAGMSSERVLGSIAALPGSVHSLAGAWQDVTASEEDTAGATRLMNEELHATIDGNAMAAQGLLKHRDAALQNEEAISNVHLAYAQSVDALKDLEAVEGSAIASKEKMQTALNNELISLKEEEATLRASIAASQDLGIQQQAIENAILRVTDAYHASNQALTEARAVSDSASASAEKLHTALNNQLVALIEQEASLKASIAGTQDLAIQQQALENATLAGVEAAMTWIAGLDEAAAKEKAEIATLQEYAAQFGELPGVIVPTISNLQDFIQANEEGGQAAIEFGQSVLDAWSGLTGDMGSKIQDLVGIIKEGGEDMKESTADWFTGIEQDIGRSLSSAEQTALKHFANMVNQGEQVLAEFNMDAMLGNLDAGFAQMVSGFEGAASQATGVWHEIFSTMADIARSGSEQAVAAMTEAFQSEAPPEAILSQMKTILSGKLPQTVGDAATAAGNAIPGKLNPGAAAAGQSAALTLSQEFAAAGVHIAAVLRGIAANMQKALGGAKGAAGTAIAIQVNIAPALKQLQSLKVQIGLVKQAKAVPINVDTRAATSATNRLRSLVNALPNIKRTITYTYRIVGSRPNPQNISRTITYRYRTVGTRPAQSGMHENLSQDTLIAAHRGERVDITPGTIHTNENRTAIIPASGANARPINIMVRGDVNGKELIRFVKFNLMEGTGGVM